MDYLHTLELPFLIDMLSDFSNHRKRILQIDSKKQELKEFREMILLVECEIKSRQPISM
jgi:hypothetical protein